MLTNTAVRNAKPRDKAFTMADERGLYMHVKPTGDGDCGKYWRNDYRYCGQRKTDLVPEVRIS